MKNIKDILAAIDLRTMEELQGKSIAPRSKLQYGYNDAYGHHIHLKPRDFDKYLVFKKMTTGQVAAMPAKKKRDFFLKWKHGMEDPNVNEELETTKAMLYARDKDVPLESISPQWREWVKKEREFYSYCNSVMMRIGLRDMPIETSDDYEED